LPKHSARQFTPARLVLGSAAAILVALVGWVAVRAGGPAVADEPVIVQPSALGGADLQAAEGSLPPVIEAAPAPGPSPSGSPSASPSASPSTSPSVSASASPSAASPSAASPSASGKPKKSASPKPSASRLPSPSPSAGGLQVTYTTGASWRDGFIGNVRVVNNGPTARDFTVTITFASGSDLRIRSDWNVAAGVDGNRVTLRGGSLAPGASVSAGFQAAKDDDDSSKASGCTVVGGTCTVR
jgi:hypothetical protein